MARIEKTVFISYRRKDVYTALAVYENLKNQGYDVFFDYRSISSGDFEQIITSNIRARAHFLLILTPTALDRSNEPGDWLRREIELAIDEKRNIIPLFFKGFRFDVPSVSEKLTGRLKNISRYNGLNVHEDYFDEAMRRLRTQYLNEPLDTVLHPVSNEVQEVVNEEKLAADKALEQKEVSKRVREEHDKQVELEEELMPKPVEDVKVERLPADTTQQATFQWQSIARVAGIVSLLLLFIWVGSSFFGKLSSLPSQMTQMSQSTASATHEPVNISTPSQTSSVIQTPITQSYSLDGIVLSVDLPSWATNPVRGSISFSKDEEIIETGTLMAFVSIRNEDSSMWVNSDPRLLLQLSPGEKLCSITRADHNSSNYWLGFQAHCNSTDACSYNIEENSRLWATIGKVEVIVAQNGGECP